MKVLNSISSFAGKYFAVLIIIMAVIAFMNPETFLGINKYLTILLGIVMFGMGLTLKPIDFKIVLTKPIPVIIGFLSQYTIMPLIAFAIATIMNLPPTLAVGLVLLGSVPGGTASNVMVYLAKGDVALSIAMTTLSTLVAPIATPAILLFLAGQWMPVDPMSMFLSIVQVIIIPIVLGFLVKRFFPIAVEKSVEAVPLISVVSIILIMSAVVAANVNNLAASGVIVFIAVILHNAFGLALGYLTAYLCKLDKTQRKAISIEVGMQNSGLGVSLATTHFTEPMAALPSAVGAVWHNITGPILATIWSKKQQELRNNTQEIPNTEVKSRA